MKVREAMTAHPVTCAPETTLREAARMMREADCDVGAVGYLFPCRSSGLHRASVVFHPLMRGHKRIDQHHVDLPLNEGGYKSFHNRGANGRPTFKRFVTAIGVPNPLSAKSRPPISLALIL